MRKLPALAVLVVAAGCGGTPGDSQLRLSVPSTATVTTVQVVGLGRVLADPAGHVLYAFPPDSQQRVTCVGPCAGTWPPYLIAGGHRPSAAGGALAAKLSTLPDPNTGARVVTYAGWPLYTYAGDVDAGTANGQNVFVDGGPWYALSVDGNVLQTDGS